MISNNPTVFENIYKTVGCRVRPLIYNNEILMFFVLRGCTAFSKCRWLRKNGIARVFTRFVACEGLPFPVQFNQTRQIFRILQYAKPLFSSVQNIIIIVFLRTYLILWPRKRLKTIIFLKKKYYAFLVRTSEPFPIVSL